MTPTRRARRRGTSVPVPITLLAILVAVAACATPAGGPGGSGSVLSRDGTQLPQDRLHRQAHDALERWADAIRKSGGASIAFVGDLTGQVGAWERALGDNNKAALAAGLVEARAALSDNAPSRDKVRWLDGSEVDVNVLSAADTLDALVAAGAGSASCPNCRALVVGVAQLATGLVDTSRGPANAPAWVFSIEGSAVKVTRIAVDQSVTVDPPPWNASDPPVGLSIESATGKADSRKLTVLFTGAVKAADQPCGVDYSAEAVESDLAVVVIVHEHPNPTAGACDAVGRTRTAIATLDTALGTRAVLEVKQGLPVSVVAP
jgi:hypothetical protein